MPEEAAISNLLDQVQGEGLPADLPAGRGSNVISFPSGLYLAGGTGALPVDELPNETQVSEVGLPETSDKAMANMTREEFDAKQETAAAKTETKFTEILGAIRLISSDLKGEMGKINTRLDNVEKSTAGVKATIVLTAVAVIAIMVGVLGYGQQWFGLGLSTRDTIRTTIKEMQEPPSLPATPNNRK